MTKASIASLKTPKKVNCLESEYTKMRSNGSQSMSERFPDLASIDAFTPGMKSIIIEIATHLSRSSKSSFAGDLKEVTRNKILLQAKKVCRCCHVTILILFVSLVCHSFDYLFIIAFFFKLCDKFVESNILLEDSPSGMICKVFCPVCGVENSLSSSENNTTGKISFTIFNFRRHYLAHHSVGFESGGGECSTAIESNQNAYDELKKHFQCLTEKHTADENELKLRCNFLSLMQIHYLFIYLEIFGSGRNQRSREEIHSNSV